MTGRFVVFHQFLTEYGRFLPLVGPISWIALIATFWLVPRFPVTVETVLPAVIAGLGTTWASLRLWQGRHRMNEPLLVADPDGLHLLTVIWKETVHLKWQEIEEIFPYRSMGKDFLGIRVKSEKRTAGSGVPRRSSNLWRWLADPPTYSLRLSDLDRSIEEIAVGLSPYVQLGPKQARKSRNLSAIGIAMSFVFPLFWIAGSWSILEPLRLFLGMALLALAFLFLKVLLRPSM